VFRIEPMTVDDLADVGRIERLCFSNPWPASAYRRELRQPQQNYYVVLREEPDVPRPDGNGVGRELGGVGGQGEGLRAVPRRTLLPLAFGRRPEAGARPGRHGRPAPAAPIVGFAGMWLLYDEAHITTIGVEPAHRGRHLGELLLVALVDEARRRGANWLTLEVRVSNEAAQNLYRKYGFSVQGTRRRYYSDNNEDAHIMWSPSLRDPAYLERLAALRRSLSATLGVALPAVAEGAALPSAVATAHERPAVGE
jgi:[ribosomal protein S18]-alanine N-acetyltransferase